MHIPIRVALATLLLWTAGCTQISTPVADNDGQRQAGTASLTSAARSSLGTQLVHKHSFANLPDRGDLVAYPAQRVVKHDGAYTWHRAGLSEDHALAAAAVGGVMNITTPAGDRLKFQYERHVEHPSGDWTWIGRSKGGAASDEVILTFGEKAAFGSISQPGKAPLKLTMSGGVSWLIETDPTKVAGIDNSATRPRKADFLIPPKVKAGAGTSMESAPATALSTTSESAQAAGTTTVDVLLGYTGGFAAAQGGQSQAVTRLYNMVEIGNQAYANSQVDARIRLVHAMQVSYPDNTANGSALEALTGFRAPSTRTTPDAAFSALRAARDQYGADLVSLVRQFNTPENDGCGIAWLIGGGQSGIDSSDEYFGYSVVSDGRDAGTDGKTYFCREETLAHELGHNMGSQHDRVSATVDGNLKYGVYPYSFGYKSGAGAGNFYTIMAYGDSGQTAYRTFSNPRTTFCGSPCGIEGSGDNARSLTQTMPLIATFRQSVVVTPPPPPVALGLYAFARIGGSETTEVHVLDGGNNFQSFLLNTASALGRTGGAMDWDFQIADYNRDGILDAYTVAKSGGSNSTEVHILNGATKFRSFLYQAATLLPRTAASGKWVYRTGDYDRDGITDIYGISGAGGSGNTEVHVLDGKTNFRSYLVNTATALGSIESNDWWKFELADYNGDGILDLFAIAKMGGSNTTEVHVLNGADRFQSYLLNRATVLHRTGTDNTWDFKVGDFNNDGRPDVYAINKQGPANRTLIHVLDGADGYRSFLTHIETVLTATGDDHSWEFALARPS